MKIKNIFLFFIVIIFFPTLAKGRLNLSLLKRISFEGHLTGIKVCDINSDNKPDILIVDFNGKLHVFYNQGDLEFIHEIIDTAEQPIGVDVGDMNADGLVDAVVTTSKINKISIFYQLKSGKLSKKCEEYPTNTGPYGITIKDLNKDNLQDVVITNIFEGNISVFYQKPDKRIVEVCPICGRENISKIETTCPRCGFSHSFYYCTDCKSMNKPQNLKTNSLSQKVDYKAGSFPYGVAVGKLNEDDLYDIAVANYNWAGISIFMQEPNEKFDEKKRIDLYTGKMPTGVAIGDINNDGKEDIAVANLGENYVTVFFQHNKGSFTQVGTLTTPGRNWNVLIEDLDKDGFSEVLVALENEYSVMVFGFDKSKNDFKLVAKAGEGNSWGIDVSDIDLDGKLEVLTSIGSGGVNIFKLNFDKQAY